MLTRWLTFTAFLAASASSERAAITVAPTCRVKGHPETELTLKCGDGKEAGVVQHWHTPFGDLHTPGFNSKLDPVFMHHDGSLVVPNTTFLHSGLYYCLLQHTEGTTLWPFKLRVSEGPQENQEHSGYEQHSSCDAFRVRRDVGSKEQRQTGVSDEQFAGAVAASVLLTFVVGFSAGALSRTHVLRCLRAVNARLQSPRKQRQADTADHGAVTALPHNNQALEMEQVWDNGSTNYVSMDTTISSTTSSPPAKPKRSFRNKQQEEQDTTAYLEGCDCMKEEERRMEEEEVAGRSLEGRNKGCDGEAEEEEREFSGFYLLGEDGGSQTGTDEDECSEEGEEKDGGQSREEKKDRRREKEMGNRSKEKGEERRRGEEEVGGNEREGQEGWREEKEGCSEDDETGSEQEDTADITGGGEGGEPASSPHRRGHRSRVIRLYQYDDDGHRYGHLPDPGPDEPGPTPRLKQRSVSLTRLNAIMAAASAGPMDTRETGREEREERPHFHMEI